MESNPASEIYVGETIRSGASSKPAKSGFIVKISIKILTNKKHRKELLKNNWKNNLKQHQTETTVL